MRLLQIILLLISLTCFSQSNTDAIIKYKIFNNTYRPNSLYSFVYLQNGITIYQPKYSTQEFANKDEKFTTAMANGLVDWFYIRIDHRQQEILLFDSFGKTRFLIKDDYNTLPWTITEETKTIAGYQCFKATVSFRGMDWEAWFTPDIALPYGPWKLHGLPGLIVEVYNADKTFTWRLEQVEYTKSDIFDKDFKTLVETKNVEPISLKKFILDEEEFHLNIEAERKRNDPLGTTVYNRVRTGYEMKYEWEE